MCLRSTVLNIFQKWCHFHNPQSNCCSWCPHHNRSSEAQSHQGKVWKVWLSHHHSLPLGPLLMTASSSLSASTWSRAVFIMKKKAPKLWCFLLPLTWTSGDRSAAIVLNTYVFAQEPQQRSWAFCRVVRNCRMRKIHGRDLKSRQIREKSWSRLRERKTRE